MKARCGVRELEPARSTYQGTHHYKYADAPVQHFGGEMIHMNSVSMGHVSFGKPSKTLAEERELVHKGAQLPKRQYQIF